MALEFDWDPKKAATNESKHGVSFDDALTVFADHWLGYSKTRGIRMKSDGNLSLVAPPNKTCSLSASLPEKTSFES
jgi:hypothetical protein